MPGADGQTPVLLAVNGATDYWYRDDAQRIASFAAKHGRDRGEPARPGARYTISVAAAVGDQERVEELLRKDASLARRLDSARRSPLSYAAHEGHRHIVRLLLEHGADPNIPEDLAPQGAALYLACCRNHLEVAELLLEHGANPNAGMDSSECCLTIGTIYHGDQAKPLQELLRRHGAYTPPYSMDVAQMKAAIRGGHEVVRDEEFLGNLIEKRDAKLLDLYLDADPNVPELLSSGCGITYPKSPALVRRLLERRARPEPSRLARQDVPPRLHRERRPVRGRRLLGCRSRRERPRAGIPGNAPRSRRAPCATGRRSREGRARPGDDRIPIEARRRDRPPRRRTVGDAAGLGGAGAA